MPVQRKVFRIEQISPVMRPTASPAARPDPQLPQDEILGELQALRMLLEQRGSSDRGEDRTSGFRQFKDEAGAVHIAIARIKEEIGALQVGPFEGGPARATRNSTPLPQGRNARPSRVRNSTATAAMRARKTSTPCSPRTERATTVDAAPRSRRTRSKRERPPPSAPPHRKPARRSMRAPTARSLASPVTARRYGR